MVRWRLASALHENVMPLKGICRLAMQLMLAPVDVLQALIRRWRKPWYGVLKVSSSVWLSELNKRVRVLSLTEAAFQLSCVTALSPVLLSMVNWL